MRHISEVLEGDFCPDGYLKARIDELPTMPYAKYLCTEHWQAIRSLALHMARHTCQRCGRPATQVHHKSYEHRGQRREIGDLEALCRDCHRSEHGIGDE